MTFLIKVMVEGSSYSFREPKRVEEAASGFEASAARYAKKAEKYATIAKALREELARAQEREAAKVAARKARKEDQDHGQT